MCISLCTTVVHNTAHSGSAYDDKVWGQVTYLKNWRDMVPDFRSRITPCWFGSPKENLGDNSHVTVLQAR